MVISLSIIHLSLCPYPDPNMFLRQFTQGWFWFPDPLPPLPLELQGYVTMSDSLADLHSYLRNLRRGHLHNGFASAVKILDSQSARKAEQTGRWRSILCLSVFFLYSFYPAFVCLFQCWGFSLELWVWQASCVPMSYCTSSVPFPTFETEFCCVAQASFTHSPPASYSMFWVHRYVSLCLSIDTYSFKKHKILLFVSIPFQFFISSYEG